MKLRSTNSCHRQNYITCCQIPFTMHI